MDYSSKPWQSLVEQHQQPQQTASGEMLRSVSSTQANSFLASFQQQQQQQQQQQPTNSLRTTYSVPTINSITTAQVNAATLSVLQNASLLHGTHAPLNSGLSNSSSTTSLLARAGIANRHPTTNSQFLNAQLSIMNSHHQHANSTSAQQPMQENSNLQALLASLQQEQQNYNGVALTRSSSVPGIQSMGRREEQQQQYQQTHQNDLFGKLSQQAAQELLLGDVNEPFSDPFEPAMMDSSLSSSFQDKNQPTGATTFSQESSKPQQQRKQQPKVSSSRVSATSPSFTSTTTPGKKNPTFLPSVSSSTIGSDNIDHNDSSNSSFQEDNDELAPEDSMLHNSCKLYPKTIAVVESALRFDPESIRKKRVLVCENKKRSATTTFWKQTLDSRKRPRRLSKYGYPINIALSNGADEDVVDLLTKAGPEVLSLPDGPDQVASLHVALEMVAAASAKSASSLAEETQKQKQDRETIIRSILSSRPESARVKDRHSNYPLHVAARFDFSLALVKSIYQAHPAALETRNFHGETPVEVAQRSSRAGEDALNLLQRLSYHKAERENRKQVMSFDKSHADLSPAESSSCDEHDNFIEV